MRKNIMIPVTPAFHAKVKRLCRKRKVPMARFIRDVLQVALDVAEMRGEIDKLAEVEPAVNPPVEAPEAGQEAAVERVEVKGLAPLGRPPETAEPVVEPGIPETTKHWKRNVEPAPAEEPEKPLSETVAWPGDDPRSPAHRTVLEPRKLHEPDPGIEGLDLDAIPWG